MWGLSQVVRKKKLPEAEYTLPHYKCQTEGTNRNNIRNWRIFKGVKTQTELAALTKKVDPEKKGVMRISIVRLENGEMRYNENQITLIANALGVVPGDLVSRNPFNDPAILQLYGQLTKEDREKLEEFGQKLARKRVRK